MPQEGPLWAGLVGKVSHPPLLPTLSVKVPHSPLPSHIHPGGQLEPCSDPLGKGHPLGPPMAVSQSVSLSLSLTFPINKTAQASAPSEWDKEPFRDPCSLRGIEN